MLYQYLQNKFSTFLDVFHLHLDGVELVKEKKIGAKTVFLCEICGLGYEERSTAQECEDYCRAHLGSCSAEISKKAVYLPNAQMLPEKE